MESWIDGSLYPDEEVPLRIDVLPDRIDFIARLCSAWDFGVLPLTATLGAVTDPAWRAAVDGCRLLTSPAYHLLRRLHGLPPLRFLGSIDPRILEDESLEHV